MRSFQELLSLSFFSLVIFFNSSLAHDSPSPTTSDGHISISPESALSAPAPAPGPSGGLGAVRANPAVENICKQTDYPDICTLSISPYMTIGEKCDLVSAVDVSIKASVEVTKNAILAGTAIASNPLTPTQLASLLKDALESYGDALDNYKQAQDALPLRDWGTVNTMLSGSITSFGDCDDTISGEDLPVLSDFNDKLTKMTSNTLAITNVIEPHV